MNEEYLEQKKRLEEEKKKAEPLLKKRKLMEAKQKCEEELQVLKKELHATSECAEKARIEVEKNKARIIEIKETIEITEIIEIVDKALFLTEKGKLPLTHLKKKSLRKMKKKD